MRKNGTLPKFLNLAQNGTLPKRATLSPAGWAKTAPFHFCLFWRVRARRVVQNERLSKRTTLGKNERLAKFPTLSRAVRKRKASETVHPEPGGLRKNERLAKFLNSSPSHPPAQSQREVAFLSEKGGRLITGKNGTLPFLPVLESPSPKAPARALPSLPRF